MEWQGDFAKIDACVINNWVGNPPQVGDIITVNGNRGPSRRVVKYVVYAGFSKRKNFNVAYLLTDPENTGQGQGGGNYGNYQGQQQQQQAPPQQGGQPQGGYPQGQQQQQQQNPQGGQQPPQGQPQGGNYPQGGQGQYGPGSQY